MNTIETYNKVVMGNIDLQNDFFPRGSLPIEGADVIVDPVNAVNAWVREQHNGLIAFTRDWHPSETNHFSDNPNYNTTWPVHCVAETPGADFVPGLYVADTDIQMFKGVAKDVDDYSGFHAHSHDGQSLESLIYPVKHDRVAFLIGGVALDVCVGSTGTDAIRMANNLIDHDRLLDIYILTDATKPVTERGGKLALKVFEKLGIIAITTDDLVAGRVMQVEEM